MGHTYVSNLLHCVFSTKGREPYITPELEERLWPMMGGIASRHKMKALEISGVADHVHMLLSLPATINIAEAMQFIKGGSSKWVHEEFKALRYFEWQQGYGAFSISVSQVDDTIAYIRNQKEHHRKRTFEEEYIGFLKAHGIEYDERYIWE